MNRLCYFIAACFLLLGYSCTNDEIANSKDVNPDLIYFDYKVLGDEANGEVTLLFQYRFAGPGGKALIVEEPANVVFDGTTVNGSKSRMTGTFYEVRKPIGGFDGEHSIVFTDVNGKEYYVSFFFQRVVLRTAIPSSIERSDLLFELDGLDAVDYVRVLLTDTSFYSEGINRVDTVRNGRILISKQELESLVNGPIHLEFHRENDREIENGTPEGGILSMTYRLRREFTLTGAIDTLK